MTMMATDIRTALSRVRSFDRIIPHWPFAGDVWSDDACRAEVARIFGCYSLNGRQPKHQWERIVDTTVPWCFLWSPKDDEVSDDILGYAVGMALSVMKMRMPAYVLMDAEKVKTLPPVRLADMSYSLSTWFPDVPQVWWAHYGYHYSRTASRWEHYMGVPLHPPYALSCAMYADSYAENKTILSNTKALAGAFRVPTVPWVQPKSPWQARELGRLIRYFLGPDVPTFAVYRTSGDVTPEWLYSMEAFSNAYNWGTVEPQQEEVDRG